MRVLKFQNGDTFPSGHPGAPDNPIRLKPVTVVGHKPKSFLDRVGQFINDEILLNKDNVRVKNYQRAEARNPNFSGDWDMASNIAEGVNVMSGGFLNRLSPTQNIGLIIDAAQRDNVIQSWFGNSGITSDNFAQNHPWLSAGINLVGDGGIYLGPKALSMTRNAVRSPLVGARMRTMKLGSVEQPELIPQSRYKVGDVEINDPNLNYRQGSQGMADDFLQSGKVRVKYEGEAAAKREKVPGRFLLTKSFNNPMFKQGGLWYDSWIISEPGATPSQSDLLITRQPLRFATKGSGPAKADLGGRRIPFNEEQLNPSNTSAFRWEDGYGFRRLSQQPIIQFPIFTK